MKQLILFVCLCLPLAFWGQSITPLAPAAKPASTWGLHAVSISATNLQYGIPFVRIAPWHPGGELGLTFLKREGRHHQHQLRARLGYFHHLLANAPYLNAQYAYQQEIKGLLGVSAGLGVGYAHLFYPGEGYRFEAESQSFAPVRVNAPYFMGTLGLGVHYLKPRKIQPFVAYELWMLGSLSTLSTSLKIGVNLQL